MTEPATLTISVALCTYNGAAYLSEQLESIAAQSVRPAELVVCDDASADGTPALIEGFAARAPFPVRLHRNAETLGATKNFERAIALCTGDIIALADQDDVWAPQKLAVMRDAFAADAGLAYAFSDAVLTDAAGREIGGKTLLARRFARRRLERAFASGRELDLMLKRDFIYGTTLAFRASLRDLVLPIPATWSHDTWICNVLAFLGERGRPLLEPLVRYRQHGVQHSGGLGDPRRAGYAAQHAAYTNLRAHLVAVRTGPPIVRDGLARIDDKLRYLRAREHIEALPPHRRFAPALREVASGRWSRFSPKIIRVRSRLRRGVRGRAT